MRTGVTQIRPGGDSSPRSIPHEHVVRGIAGLTLALSLILGGCVLSVEPVVSESDAIFDPRILGCWEEVDGSDRIRVTREDGEYAIEYMEGAEAAGKQETSTFGGRLGRLDEWTVLDVWPTRQGELNAHDQMLLQGHLLVRLEIGSEEITTAIIDPDRMTEALAQGELSLAYTSKEGEPPILRGSSDELRSALGSYIAKPDVLQPPTVWRRASSAQCDVRAPVAVVPPCFEASAWREADLMFRRDAHWIGADGASSVDLGGGRILWLFGDTWIDPAGNRSRQRARMISNSVGIQSGTDPARSAIKFYWGTAADGGPAAFLADRGEERLWLGNGVRVGDRLVLFFSRVRATDSGLGFETEGWGAVLVDNPDAEPSSWRMTALDTPANELGVVVGGAAALVMDGHVYAFGSQDPVKSHPIFVVRWPVASVREGNFNEGEWWAGDRFGWVSESSSTPRQPLFNEGQSELTVHVDPATEQWLVVQTVGFGPADIALRSAPSLTGPWTAPRLLYRPSEYYRPNVMIYAAKAHPHLTGAYLPLTYANNS
ncbi:MAG: DUF4185 domain-containing protein, partial [Acidobacteria bacterium]|nr:DUF4185 domain-containing protein [Acidobacteriota bacterium]